MDDNKKVIVATGAIAAIAAFVLLRSRENLDMDLIQYYLDNYGEPGACDTSSALAAINHHLTDTVVEGFDRPINKQEVEWIVDCWEEQ